MLQAFQSFMLVGSGLTYQTNDMQRVLCVINWTLLFEIVIFQPRQQFWSTLDPPSVRPANLILDTAGSSVVETAPFLPYSWVNENWAFLAENYVILEYFITRNMTTEAFSRSKASSSFSNDQQLWWPF